MHWATSFFLYVCGFCTFFSTEFFIDIFGLCGFKHNYASTRVLFDSCQFSLKPYVFSWHLYHSVRLIQTQLSVCVYDFEAGRGRILVWLLVAALPACLYSSAALVTWRSQGLLKLAVGQRHIWMNSIWHDCWCGCVGGCLDTFRPTSVCSPVFQYILWSFNRLWKCFVVVVGISVLPFIFSFKITLTSDLFLF